MKSQLALNSPSCAHLLSSVITGAQQTSLSFYAGNRMQGLSYTCQALYHGAVSQPLSASFPVLLAKDFFLAPCF